MQQHLLQIVTFKLSIQRSCNTAHVDPFPGTLKSPEISDFFGLPTHVAVTK